LKRSLLITLLFSLTLFAQKSDNNTTSQNLAQEKNATKKSTSVKKTQKKRSEVEKLRYALKHGIIKYSEIPVEKYIKLKMWNELKHALSVIPSKSSFQAKFKKYALSLNYSDEIYKQLLKTIPKRSLKQELRNKWSDRELKKYKISKRYAYKNGPIGERYVPYTEATYYTTDTDTYTINGQARTISKTNSHTSGSGGYNEKVYGYKAIVEFRNDSDNYYLTEIVEKWVGTTSEYKVRSRGAWGDGGKESYLSTRKVNFSHDDAFILKPHSKHKIQFEVGETEPKLLNISINNIRVISKEFAEDFLKALSNKNEDLALVKKFLNDDTFQRWHKRLQENYHQIFKKIYLPYVRVKILYDTKNYDPDFNNEITVLITTPRKMYVTYRLPNGEKKTKLVNIILKDKMSVKDIKKDDLKSTIIDVQDY
jgi:hypothetical protein